MCCIFLPYDCYWNSGWFYTLGPLRNSFLFFCFYYYSQPIILIDVIYVLEISIRLSFNLIFYSNISIITEQVHCCRYKPSPQEVAACCDVTFAMLADPESAVSIFYLQFFGYLYLQFFARFFFSFLFLIVNNLIYSMKFTEGKNSIQTKIPKKNTWVVYFSFTFFQRRKVWFDSIILKGILMYFLI